MASSSEPADETTPEERAKQVTAWLRRMLERSVREDLDDNAFVTLYKLMKLQEAAEEDAWRRIKVLKERTKFFNEKSENLEAGLRVGKIAPDQLPEEARDIVKTHATVAVLLGVEDSQPERSPASNNWHSAVLKYGKFPCTTLNSFMVVHKISGASTV